MDALPLLVRGRPATSISDRFSYALIGVVTLLLLVFSTIAIIVNVNESRQKLEGRLQHSMTLAQTSLPIALWNLDNDVINDFIQALFIDESVADIRVFWNDRIFATRTREQFAEIDFSDPLQMSDFISDTADILFQGNKIGSIQIRISAEGIRDALRLNILTIVSLTMLLIVGIYATSVVITKRYILKPLSTLQQSATSIASGNLDAPIQITERDEIGALAGSLNGMRESIKNLIGELRESNEKLEDYGRTLELKVDERTKELEQAVREIGQARTRLVDAIESISEGFCLFDQDDRLALSNSRYRQMLYPGIEETIKPGMRFSEIIRSAAERGLIAEAVGRVDEWVDERMASHRSLSAPRVQWRTHDLWVQVSERKTDDGGTVAVYTDISEIKRSERTLTKLVTELELARDQATEANRFKSQFLANMSHELRTPLAAILGYAELISDGIYGEVTKEISDVLERLEQNGHHLLALVNDVLDLSKIEAGRFSLSVSDYSMTDITATALVAVESLAHEKSLLLTSEIPDDLPVGHGDAQRITQVLLNLLGNAIKFTEEGKISVQVLVANENFVISVSDDGPGMSEAEQLLIFEEFHQGDSSNTREKGGTGLGLAIAKRLVELHGGRISVESRPSEGATFKVTLPIWAGERGSEHEQADSGGG